MATVQDLAQLLQDQQRARRHAQYGGPAPAFSAEKAEVIPGRVYTKVDFNDSGKLMVENATGKIFGIKAYGQVHRGHQYGTLETINDWYWGEFYPRNPIELEA